MLFLAVHFSASITLFMFLFIRLGVRCFCVVNRPTTEILMPKQVERKYLIAVLFFVEKENRETETENQMRCDKNILVCRHQWGRALCRR